jgi:tetratricopeptide (TPR) repeat protein
MRDHTDHLRRPRAQPHAWAHRVAAFTIACGLGLSATPAQALPTDPEAKAHLEKGTELFKAGEFDAAIEQYKQGYEKQEDPVFLYAWAQAELRQEHCAAAVKLYRKYLETNPPEMSAEAARQGILECADKLAADDTPAPVDEPATDPVGDDTAPIDDTPPDDEKPRRAKKPVDAVAISLTAVGVAGVGAGIGVLAAGLVEKKKASETYGEFDDRQARARTMTIAGSVVLGVGAAVLVGGIVRFAIVGSRAKKQNSSVSALLSPNTAGVVFSGRF